MVIDKTTDHALSAHLVIFAWEEKLLSILDYVVKREKKCGRSIEKLIIAGNDNTVPWEKLPGETIFRVIGEPTDNRVLELAEVEKSRNIIILADERERTLADAKSILIVLALKSISREIHVCVEAVDPDNIASLKLARADRIISIPNLREKLLAQSAITHYISNFYSEIFDLQTDQNILPVPVNGDLAGKTVEEVSRELYDKGALLLAVIDNKDGRVRINPSRQHVLVHEESVLVLARQDSLDMLHACHWL